MLINSYVFLFFFLYNICNDAKAKKKKNCNNYFKLHFSCQWWEYRGWLLPHG